MPPKDYHWIGLQNESLLMAFHPLNAFLGLLLLWDEPQTPKHGVVLLLPSLSDESFPTEMVFFAFHVLTPPSVFLVSSSSPALLAH